MSTCKNIAPASATALESGLGAFRILVHLSRRGGARRTKFAGLDARLSTPSDKKLQFSLKSLIKRVG